MKRTVYIFYQRPETIEDSEIIFFTPYNLHIDKVLSKPAMQYFNEHATRRTLSKYTFKKPKSITEYTLFLQTLRDLLPVDIYFGMKKNGNLWIVEHSEKNLYNLDMKKLTISS